MEICRIEPCTKPVKARELCAAHHSRYLRTGDPLTVYTPKNKTPCSVEGCTALCEAKGLCTAHYKRKKRHGQADTRLRMPKSQASTLPGKLQERTPEGLPETECWEWSGSRTEKGYGTLLYNGKRLRAHRVAYALANRVIPEGLLVRHKCDNPPCVNPGHLEVGTPADNTADMISRGRAVFGGYKK